MFKMLINKIIAILCMAVVHRTAMASIPTKDLVNDVDDWWRHAVLYQIYPRSFLDTNFDGIGDLRGITHKLTYLHDTGITAIWLSPIFQAPTDNFGYGITDYKDIHHDYGTMQDFEELIRKAKGLNTKIVLDFVPNHTSDQCLWFKKSFSREKGYEDFYVWADGRIDENTGEWLPPNNWNSLVYGSAWSWHPKRQQYYLHHYSAQQPDLNFRNPALIKAIDDVLLFWLDKGVQGFRIITTNYLYKPSQLTDEPLRGKTNSRDSYDLTENIYSRNQSEVLEMLYHWRSLLDEYSLQNGGPRRILMTDAPSDLKLLANYYESDEGLMGAHIPANFLLLTEVTDKSDARDFAFNIQKWLICMPGGHTANWIMGSHDQPRIGSKFSLDSVDPMNMLLMTLPGVAVTYSGEELGMQDYRAIKWQDTKDPVALSVGPKFYQSISRDPVRTPFQWSAEKNAGFSKAPRTWLPVHPSYLEHLNLKTQLDDEKSHYKVYKSLIQIRQEPVLREGRCQVEVVNKWVFAVISLFATQLFCHRLSRSLKNHRSFITLINVGSKPQLINVFNILDDVKHLRILISGVYSKYPVGRLFTQNPPGAACRNCLHGSMKFLINKCLCIVKRLKHAWELTLISGNNSITLAAHEGIVCQLETTNAMTEERRALMKMLLKSANIVLVGLLFYKLWNNKWTKLNFNQNAIW
uniref:alpha-glucosidase n=1 Tax=Glossina pallidipes TaxID=7398 RepID=A0A1B0A4G3_GLOPL